MTPTPAIAAQRAAETALVERPSNRSVIAVFSDGTVKRRNSISRVYTHAWLLRWSSPTGDGSKSGFASSEDLAWKAMISMHSRHIRGGRTMTFDGVEPITELSPAGPVGDAGAG